MTETVNTPEPRQRPDLVGALLLITVGTLLLFNNFNLVPWSIWHDLLQYWPVVLILIGLQMVLGYSSLGRLVVGVITVGVIFYIVGNLVSHPQIQRLPYPFGFGQYYRLPHGNLGDPGSL
jgi:hypothetical protein